MHFWDVFSLYGKDLNYKKKKKKTYKLTISFLVLFPRPPSKVGIAINVFIDELVVLDLIRVINAVQWDQD